MGMVVRPPVPVVSVVVIVVVPVPVSVPPPVIFIPPAVIVLPAVFACFLQFVPPVRGLLASPPVMLRRFVQFVIGFDDAALAVVVRLGWRRSR